MDFSGIIDRIKDNKLAIPAILGGVVIGGYVLIKNGGMAGGSNFPSVLPTTVPDTGTSGGGSGGGSGSDSGGVPPNDSLLVGAGNEDTNRTFQQSIIDQFNALVDTVNNALAQRQTTEQTQPDYGSQIADQIGGALGNLPNFSALYNTPYPSNLPQANAPKLAIGSGGLSKSSAKLSSKGVPLKPTNTPNTILPAKAILKMASKPSYSPQLLGSAKTAAKVKTSYKPQQTTAIRIPTKVQPKIAAKKAAVIPTKTTTKAAIKGRK